MSGIERQFQIPLFRAGDRVIASTSFEELMQPQACQ
jgi:hypothetical protein